MKPLQTFLARLSALPRKGAAAKLQSGPFSTSAPRPSSSTSVDIAATIEQALAAAGLRPSADRGKRTDAPISRAPSPTVVAKPAGRIFEGVASPLDRQPSPRPATTAERAGTHARGVSIERNFANAAGARAYTLYVPAGLDPSVPAPLVLMLHGCTQTPADFATGTRMNVLADAYGVLVAYPAQTPRDNGNRCWNWFRRQDQARGEGEPSILADIVADIAADHRVDPQRVYAAGLSAGAAMAVILGQTYPDVFAAVGAHSGLPFGAAQDMPGAFAAMQGRAATSRSPPTAARAASAGKRRAMPTIVFHGDADHTVNGSNGRAIVEDAVAASADPIQQDVAPSKASPNGRTYTRETYAAASGPALAEHWTLHGGGHTWSGGDPAGSHVDPSGPDASAEILRFFLQHTNPRNSLRLGIGCREKRT